MNRRSRTGLFISVLFMGLGFVGRLPAAPLDPAHPDALWETLGIDDHLQPDDGRVDGGVAGRVSVVAGRRAAALKAIDTVSGDTPESLAGRLLPREHALLCACVDAIARGLVTLGERGVMLDGVRLTQPMNLLSDGQLCAAVGAE